jgi:hypothetical protein
MQGAVRPGGLAMGEFTQMGGIVMWPTLAFGLLAIVSGWLYAADPLPERARRTIAAGLLTVVTGLAGTSLGAVVTLTHMGGVPPEKQFIALIGLGESLCNLALALMLCTVTAALGVVGTWRGRGSVRAVTSAIGGESRAGH